MSELGQFALFFAVGLGFLGFFFSPIAKAMGRRIDPGTARDPEPLRELEARVSELEANCERMAELEERLDFAERMLAKQRDAERLPEGQP